MERGTLNVELSLSLSLSSDFVFQRRITERDSGENIPVNEREECDPSSCTCRAEASTAWPSKRAVFPLPPPRGINHGKASARLLSLTVASNNFFICWLVFLSAVFPATRDCNREELTFERGQKIRMAALKISRLLCGI